MDEEAKPIEIRVMNDYGGGIPLWDPEGHTDGEELGLSHSLRADLAAFAERWDASIDPEAYDDRWDGVPVMRTLVALGYSLRRLVNPARRRAAMAEDAGIRSEGEGLSRRVQNELGSGYVVTYKH